MSDDRPNPGSEDARQRGCICAILDNCHGMYPPIPPNGWYITVGCRVHDASGRTTLTTPVIGSK